MSETKDLEVKRPEPPRTITRRNSRGLYETVDVHTGRIIVFQVTPQDLLQSKFDQLVRIETPEGPVWLEKGINFDIIGRAKAIPYSKLLGDLVCESIFLGNTLKVAAEELGLSYSVVIRWKRENPEFKAALDEAKIDAAQTFHDKALEVAEKSCDDKLLVNTLQWAAGLADPEQYGTKTKIIGDRQNPVAFVFNTGIDRTPEKEEEKDASGD